MKKLFKTHFLIRDYINAESEKIETEEYNEEFMDLLWHAQLGLHTQYLFNLLGLIAIIKFIFF